MQFLLYGCFTIIRADRLLTPNTRRGAVFNSPAVDSFQATQKTNSDHLFIFPDHCARDLIGFSMSLMSARYAVFLRGINVGGNRTIKMADLRRCFEGLGFEDVCTVLQSGNVLFTSTSRSADALRSKIEAALTKTFAYPAKVYLCPLPTLERAIKNYPFDLNQTTIQHYVVLGGDKAVDTILMEAVDLDQKTEEVKGNAPFIYWRVQKGKSTKSAFAKILAKAKYRDHTTVRNMNTLKKMVGK